uniref:hypothetical protein n=1 Tax=Yoonia sp. R2-816 TaxID=3342638 RepID=UPI00372A4631
NLQIQFHGEYPHALPSNERAKVADFYAARDNTTPPLPWPSIAPPITHRSTRQYQKARRNARHLTLELGQTTTPNQDVARVKGGLDIEVLICHTETLL